MGSIINTLLSGLLIINYIAGVINDIVLPYPVGLQIKVSF